MSQTNLVPHLALPFTGYITIIRVAHLSNSASFPVGWKCPKLFYRIAVRSELEIRLENLVGVPAFHHYQLSDL